MFRFFQQVFISFLTFSRSLVTKRVPLNNQPCLIRHIVINFIPDEHNQGLQYYPFIISLVGCQGSCNSIDGPSDKICALNKKKDENLNVFNMMTRIHEPKTLIKDISCT